MLLYYIIPLIVQFFFMLRLNIEYKFILYVHLCYMFKMVPLYKTLKRLETTCYLLGFSSHKI